MDGHFGICCHNSHKLNSLDEDHMPRYCFVYGKCLCNSGYGFLGGKKEVLDINDMQKRKHENELLAGK